MKLDDHYDDRGVLVKPHDTPADLGGVLSRGAQSHDPVNHPAHYTRNGIECLDAIEALGLGYHLGNALKYIWRAGFKGDAVAVCLARRPPRAPVARATADRCLSRACA